jgi:hypothetical protein
MARTPQTTNAPALSDIELERRIPVSEAARIQGISEDTFRRCYPDLIEQLSERRQGVKLRNVIACKTPST